MRLVGWFLVFVFGFHFKKKKKKTKKNLVWGVLVFVLF